MSEYEPAAYHDYPHRRYRCPCGERAIAIGWEVETCVCTECGSLMEYDADLYHPRDDYWGSD